MHPRTDGRSPGIEPSTPGFSLAHLTVLGCPPPEMIQLASRAGYDFVGLRTICMGLANEANYALARNPAMLRETKHALAETGIRVHDVELARIADDVDVATYAPALDVAAELGARYVICSIWTNNDGYVRDSVIRLCESAEAVGLGVSLEFLTWSPLPDLAAALALRASVGRPNCGLLIDTLHFNRSRVRLEELDDVPPEFIHFIHVCDAGPEIPSTAEGLIYTARESRLDPGQGAIDIRGILARLPSVTRSLEVPNLKRVKEVGYAEHARLCLENARAYLCGSDCAAPAGWR